MYYLFLVYKAYKYRLYPTPSQQILLAKHFGCVRFAYNYALELKIKAWKAEKKSLSQYDLCKEFPKLKKQEATAWLSEVCAHSLQCEMANLNAAYTRFFKEKEGFPTFKSKHSKRSYTTGMGVAVGDNYVKLSKLGKVKAVISRPLIGHLTSATVSQTSTGKYFVSVLCKTDEIPPEKAPVTFDNTIGIDLGITHFATLSTGEKIANPRLLKKSLARLKRAQKAHSRRIKGSKNRDRARRKVASIHEKVRNRRSDFLHKLSTQIVRENQAIALEMLNISGMQKNSRLAQSISDVGWASFISMLEYKAERHGKTVLRIGRFEPSSKMCSCGVINRELKLSDRDWTCSACDVTHDRDILAANNIKDMALHPLQSTEAWDCNK